MAYFKTTLQTQIFIKKRALQFVDKKVVTYTFLSHIYMDKCCTRNEKYLYIKLVLANLMLFRSNFNHINLK